MAEKENKIESIRIPEEIPLIALKNTVIFPFLSIPLLIGRGKSLIALDEALRKEDIVMLVTQKDASKEDIASSDLYEHGTASIIKQMFRLPDGSVKCVVEGIMRGKIASFTQTDPFFMIRFEKMDDIIDVTPEEFEKFKITLRVQIENFLRLGIPFPTDLAGTLTAQEDPCRLVDLLASYLLPDTHQRQIILKEPSVSKRMEKLSNFFAEELRRLKLQTQIMSKVQEEMGKTQREYFLRQQLKAIQEELGEMDETQAEIYELKKRVEEKNMPKEVNERALKEIDRLSKMPTTSPEHSWIRTYLEWLLDVPWSERTEDKIDIEEAKKILDSDHYNLEKVKEHILDFLAVTKLKGRVKGPILCFIGPPGVGKTSLGQSIARALGRKFYRMSLGGIRDEAEIRGHRRTYVGALPGRIIQGVTQVKTINPVFMLDEIDKVGADFRGDPSAALLEVLDPEQNFSFQDNYLNVPYDLSNVMFITTANVADTILPTLRDRMEILNIPGYGPEEKLNIAKKFLVKKQIKEQGLGKFKIKFTDKALLKIINEYTSESGVRNLEREISSICRKIAREVVQNGESAKVIFIKPADIEKYLGVPKILPSQIEDKDRIGIATGIAVTPVGGDIMFVECILYPGEGKLTLTGQLGEVMQESAKASMSFVEAKAENFNLEPGFFNKHDIHIHVPEGAIPKDGPSAGVAIVIALISAATKQPVRRDVAMTGEITLRGRILPIGGVKAKLLAAHRAGIKKLILPSKNEKDLTEIPDEIKKALEIELVEDIEEVCKFTLVTTKERQKRVPIPD